MFKIKTIVFLLLGSFGFAQEVLEKTKTISSDACDCISKVDLNLEHEEKLSKIKSCISGAIVASQFEKKLSSMVNKTMDTLNKIDDISKIDTLNVVDKEINIVLNDEEDYEEIERYLYDNCPTMKMVYFTENKEYENSYSNRKKAMKFYEEGQIAFTNQEFEKAITLFNKAVNKDDKFAFAWDNLGYSYRKTGNYKMAIKCYNKSLALDPRGKMPLMNLPVAYELDNDVENAITAYENLQAVYEDDPESYYGLGRMYIYEENYEKALDNMIMAYKLYLNMDSPYNIDAQKNIVLIYNKLKEQKNLDLFYSIAKKYNLEINEED